MAITGTKSNELPALPGSIPDSQLVLVPDPITGELLRSTFGQMKADITLAIGAISYLDQIIEVPTIAALPQPGAIKTIYVITTGPDANKQFRWGGSIYIEFPQGSGDVAGEAVIRGNADVALQANINAVGAALAAAQSTLQSNVDSEALARANADIILNNKISAEANTRSTNDSILQGLINSEGIIRANADSALSARITAIEGAGGGVAIDDTTSSLTKVYSSQKTQDALDLKLNIADYNPNFRGKYTSLASLQAAVPTALPGNYAQVDTGAGFNVVNYNWDDEDGWALGSSIGPTLGSTDDLVEGSTNLYFTAARAIAAIGTVSVARGGTGITSYVKGDLIYASAANVLSALAKDADGKVLALAGGVPIWSNGNVNTAADWTWTGKHQFNNSVIASSGVALGISFNPSLTSSNPADILSAVDFNPSFSGTATKKYGVRIISGLFGKSCLTGNISGATTGFAIGSANEFDGTAYGSGGYYIWLRSGRKVVSGDYGNGDVYSEGFGIAIGHPTSSYLKLDNSGATIGGTKLTISTAALSLNLDVLDIGIAFKTFESTPYYGIKNYQSGQGWHYAICDASSNMQMIVRANGNVLIGTTTNRASALLNISSTSQGVLLPRMTTTNRDAIPVTSSDEGLEIFNITTHKKDFYNGSAWEQVTSA